jgi:hypothetical protein
MKDILQSRAICAVQTADFYITTQFLPAFCLRKFAPLKGIPMPETIWHLPSNETFIF